MLTMFVIAFILAAILYDFIVVPKMTTDIAVRSGFEQKKWIFYCIVLNVFALAYLYLSLASEQNREKAKLLILILGYFAIFFGAYAIDTYTDF